jgi:hypothetical protein
VARVRRGLALALATAAVAALPAVAHAARSVPPGWVGMVVEGPALEPDRANLSHEMDLMVRSGVETIRVVFPWGDEQPYPNWDSVPPDKRRFYRDVAGVPTNFAYTDRIMAEAAVRHIQVLPVIWRAPAWDAQQPKNLGSTPKETHVYARYAGALAQRYGPNGGFWAERPALPQSPIKTWQIWNEPNIFTFWNDQPFAPGYVALLREARLAILSADPTARIAIAGLVNESWTALQRFYDAGGQGLFDVMAVHPFTLKVGGVVTILRRIRAVMAAHGDAGKPLLVTELAWPSAVGKVKRKWLRGFEVTVDQQAERVRDAYKLLAHWRRRLNIEQVDWYSWLRYDAFRTDTFDYSGLRHISTHHFKIEDKPAAGAFKKEALKLEGCRRKGPTATDCRTH